MNLERILKDIPDGPIDMLQLLEPGAYTCVEELVASGVLPSDTFLRLDSLGDGTSYFSEIEGASQRWAVLVEISEYDGNADNLSLFARNILFGEPPKALLSWHPDRDGEMLHSQYEHPYLTRLDLADVIEERRAEEGTAVQEVPLDKRWKPPNEIERTQCLRIAHKLWSILARRIMPEWLETGDLEYYFRPQKEGNNIELASSQQEMNRLIVSAVALSVVHIKNVYDEALDVGVKNIGPIGKRDLRVLLAEEYPELREED